MPSDDLLAAARSYATRKLGYVVLESTRDRFSEAEARAWDDAIADYLAEHADEDNGTE